MADSSPATSPKQIVVMDSPINVGRSKSAHIRLLHPTVSGNHATLLRQGDSLVVEDHDSTYGTFVNGGRIKRCSLEVSDRVMFGPQVSYRVSPQGLELEESTHGLQVTGRDITIVRDGKLLVKNADFEIVRDSFVGVLGPSGIGKSTLLSCLATFLIPGRGSVVFDGEHDLVQHREEIRAMLGHVPQDDAVLNGLTVAENLAYAAQLRLGAESSADDILFEVQRVLTDVGLTAHADKLTSKLSGGQRKRLSVAVELLRRPRLLLLDEPTSGLDPATESNLMSQLRHLANKGTTVVCTTHMMDNLRLFDSVIVFGKRDECGQIAYVGSPLSLLPHFECKNFADLYERLEQGEFQPYRVSTGDLADTEGSSATLAAVGVPVVNLVKAKTDTADIASSEYPTLKQLAADFGMDESAVRQIGILVARSFRLLRRDRSLLATIVGQPLGLGILNALSQYAALHTDALLFFSIVIAAWLGLNNSARDLVADRRRLYVRERLAGLKRGAFLASKAVVHTLIGAAQLLLLLLVLKFSQYTAQEQLVRELQDTSFIWLFCVMLSVYVCALGLGLLISALVKSEEAAVALLPLLIMPQLLISAVGTGESEKVFHVAKEHVPFRPVVLAARNLRQLEPSARVAELASLACYTRPAILLVKPPNAVADRHGLLFADALHLFLLAVTTWTATIVGFQWAEERWGRLIGIG